MRILQLAQKPQRRGAEIFAAQLGAWLARSGHEVRHAYLYRYEGSRPLAVTGGDVSFEEAQDSPFERLPWGNLRLLTRLHRLVLRWRPDVVQANGGRSVKYAAMLTVLAPRRHWKLVYRNIDSPIFWVRGLARKLYLKKLVMPRVDGVVGVSRHTLEEVYQFYGLNVPGEFIPNGIDLGPLDASVSRLEARRRLDVPSGRCVVLFFGAITAQKRPDRFVRLVHRLREAGEDVEGWVVGDGEGRAASEALAQALGVKERLRFHGYQIDAAELITATDVLVSTSDTEGIPAAVLEASYLRVPVVGFAVGGMPECVLDGETGLLARPGDEEELLSLARRLVQQVEERLRLGRNGRHFVAANFSMDIVGRRYESFYRKLRMDRGAEDCA